MRNDFEEEVKKKEIEELKDQIAKLKPILDKVSIEDIVKGIREDRDSR